MNPHDSDELADRIDEQFVISVNYGRGVAVVERRGGRRRVYALEVYVERDEYDGDVASIDVSGTEVVLPLEQLREVLGAARSRPEARRLTGPVEGLAHRRALAAAAHAEDALALGHRRWFADDGDASEPVLVWIDWQAGESMFALHLGSTELLVRPEDLDSAMAGVTS